MRKEEASGTVEDWWLQRERWRPRLLCVVSFTRQMYLETNITYKNVLACSSSEEGSQTSYGTSLRHQLCVDIFSCVEVDGLRTRNPT